jgi:hypothetical protein
VNSLPPAGKPRSTVARRVLASFGVTVVAFAVTLGLGIAAQRRAAEDSVELGRGYAPVALRLAQLRAAQTTLSTLVEGIPDEREPGSTRAMLETLVSARRAMFAETRGTIAQTVTDVRSEAWHALADGIASDLGGVETSLEADRVLFEQLFAAIASGDRDGVNRTLVSLGAVEQSRSGPSSTTPTSACASLPAVWAPPSRRSRRRRAIASWNRSWRSPSSLR